MFRPTRSLMITLRQVKDSRSLHRFNQQFAEIAEYECTFCLWLYLSLVAEVRLTFYYCGFIIMQLLSPMNIREGPWKVDRFI